MIGLATFGAIIGWAVVSTSWISDRVAALLTPVSARRRSRTRPKSRSTRRARSRSFFAYDLGFFVDHTLKHRIPALWELHKAHHRRKC